MSKPPDVESAMRAYRSAIDILPNMPFKQRISEKASGKAPARSGVEEITEDEAAELKAASSTSPDPAKEEADERERIEDAIRQCQKASWGNLAACHVSLVSRPARAYLKADLYRKKTKRQWRRVRKVGLGVVR